MPDHNAIPETDILVQELENEIVILNLKNETYYRIDGAGIRMWQLIEQHASLSKVSQIMSNEYNVDTSILQEDVAQFAKGLHDKGIVRLTTVDLRADGSSR